MGLINVPAINDGDTGNGELWNSRFSEIVDEINGNLDADNLADEAVTTPKIADGAVTNSKIDDNTIDPAKMENPIAFKAHRTTNQALSATTWTKLQASTEAFDYGANYDNATNYRFTAPIDGIYSFSAGVRFDVSENILVALYKNGSEVARGVAFEVTTAGGATATSVATLLELDATDYVECFVWSDDAANVTSNTTTGAGFCGYLVGQLQ